MALEKLGENLYLYPGSPSTMIKAGEKLLLLTPETGAKDIKSSDGS
jgi:hypothetical protein